MHTEGIYCPFSEMQNQQDLFWFADKMWTKGYMAVRAKVNCYTHVFLKPRPFFLPFS